MQGGGDGSTGRSLVLIDCTQEMPAGRYFGHGDVRVVDGPAGRYREAEAKPLSRFGYRFTIDKIGAPHVAVLTVPDDKRRFMVIGDGTCYDLSTGLVTGFAHPLSGTMVEIRQVFWPRWKDCSITFMTWGHGEPAAVARIQVFELAELSALELPGDPSPGREIGIQYEDPCGTGGSEGAMSREEWLDRVVSYACHTGQRLLSYPIAWYHGPQFPSEREPSDAFDLVVARDRKQYTRWTSRPPEWVAPLLERFGREGLEFQGVLTLLRLGSLMQRMNTDIESTRRGEDTINNLLWCDKVQSGTMDWTPIYNVRNYPQALDYYEKGKDMKDFPWVYGEKTGQGYHPGPIFNCLHPVVQEAVIGFVREIGERYGRYPAFRGIAITMWAPTIIWFGSLHAGYDDYTVGLFEKETAIKVDVDRKAPDRFSRRYQWLTHYCRPAWIEWRCRKIGELIAAMARALREARADLRITLNLWSEPYIPAILGWGGTHTQLGARPATAELYREAGLDVELLRDESGVEMDLQLDGGSRDRTPGNEEHAPIERFTMFRDHDYLDRRTLDKLRSQPSPGVFIFNAWHEAWGTHRWFRCEEGDRQAEELAVMCGQKTDGVFRLNSTYPPDGFWWDSQLRITPAFPAGHFMEPYAHAVAELDALRITRGGLFLDKAHSDEIRAFARAYRPLPRRRFSTVGSSTDPVAVRSLEHAGSLIFYLVNREYYDVQVELTFEGTQTSVTDLATLEQVRIGKPWRLQVGRYELRSFRMSLPCRIESFTSEIPAEIERELTLDAELAVRQIEALGRISTTLPGISDFSEELLDALRNRRYAWLRRALTSYPIRKCRELLKA